MTVTRHPDAEHIKMAKVLRVVNEGDRHARLYIDGVLFPWATVDGYHVDASKRHPKYPGVSVTIAGWRVEVIDDLAPPSSTTPDVDHG